MKWSAVNFQLQAISIRHTPHSVSTTSTGNAHAIGNQAESKSWMMDLKPVKSLAESRFFGGFFI
ncbi:hypothetical protein [Brevibacillus reuszeri]|uniref:hypothetical protein n=1 Tax=Brevibacillus reuszeri TaxID=54915 RepID=UPI0028971316|nr:hypothetical protein [Brevibacillus reuszeri]